MEGRLRNAQRYLGSDSGLKTLHDNKILHRDLKSANVFLSDGVAKIGDLNISKILKNDMATTQTGTPYYSCP